MSLVKIPIRIVSESNKGGEHWTKKSKRHKIQKLLVRSYLQHQEKPTQFPCYITLVRHAPREFDPDNLQSAFKYVRDAVSEYLLDCHMAGRADNDPRLIWKYSQEKTTDKEYYITIEVSTCPLCSLTLQELL